MFRSVFPTVSTHLKPSGKKGKNLGYLQPGSLSKSLGLRLGGTMGVAGHDCKLEAARRGNPTIYCRKPEMRKPSPD